VNDSMETTCSGRISKKVRTLAIGALATAALSIPAVSAVTVVAAHDAKGAPVRVFSPASHRLALTITSHSVRLT
jgi:hypothetical protein